MKIVRVLTSIREIMLISLISMLIFYALRLIEMSYSVEEIFSEEVEVVYHEKEVNIIFNDEIGVSDAIRIC